MRKYKKLEQLLKDKSQPINKAGFADLLINELKNSSCMIYGETIEDKAVLLAELITQKESLQLKKSIFNQKIEFVVKGKIINDQYPAITYKVGASTFQFYGRCSTIPQICGVDLYLDKSYTGVIGDSVSQKFFVPVDKLFSALKKFHS